MAIYGATYFQNEYTKYKKNVWRVLKTFCKRKFSFIKHLLFSGKFT